MKICLLEISHIVTDYAICEDVENLYKKLGESDEDHNYGEGGRKIEKRLLFLL